MPRRTRSCRRSRASRRPRERSSPPDGSRVYITSAGENVLTVVDRATGRVIRKVPLSGHANDLVVTRDGRRILVCIAETPGAVDVIDAASLELIKTIPARSRMHDIVVTHDGKYAVAGSPQGEYVIVYDLQTLEPAWELELDRGVMPITLEHRPGRLGQPNHRGAEWFQRIRGD